MRPFSALLALSLFAPLAPLAVGQTPIGGNVFDGGGGPLLADNVYYSTSHIVIPPGQTLTIQQGVTLKMAPTHSLIVNGVLLVQGVAIDPVWITSIKDDLHGGDTNLDNGATVPAAGDWAGIAINVSDATNIAHARIAYAGWGNSHAINVSNSDFTLSDTQIGKVTFGGLHVDSQSFPHVSRCSFEGCGAQPAVTGAVIDSLPGYSGNVAFGTVNGDFIRVDQSVPGSGGYLEVFGNTVISPGNVINGVLVPSFHISVRPGASLTLTSGLIVKPLMQMTLSVDPGGKLEILGTRRSPVIMTSIHDDAVGGDTQLDGNTTSPVAGDWRGIDLLGGALPSKMENVLMRFSGYGSAWSVQNAAAGFEMRDVRVEHAVTGFNLSNAAIADDLVTWDLQQYGFRLWAGSFALRRCTAVAGGQSGFFKTGSFSGTVTSSIGRSNVGGDFSGFAAGQVNYCTGTGIVGGVANANANPQFVNEGFGDLRLLAGSQCIDTGDPFDVQTGVDAYGTPRCLDGTLSGTQLRIDRGAYEFSHVSLDLSGINTPGGNLNIGIAGTPGMQTFLILGTSEQNQPFSKFGRLLVGTATPFQIYPWPSAPSVVTLPIPGNVPTPLGVVAQALVVTPGYQAGNTSNTDSVVIQ